VSYFHSRIISRCSLSKFAMQYFFLIQMLLRRGFGM
jgi:hypothetical protein